VRLLVFVLLGCAALVGLIVGLAFMAARPGLDNARRQANEASAIASLRLVTVAQMTFAATCANNSFARSLRILGLPPRDGGQAFAPPDLSAADRVTRSRYTIWIEAAPAAAATSACNGAAPGDLADRYVVRAEPLEGGGTRYFAVTEKGDIFQSDRTITFDASGQAEPPAKPLL
jgi:hypothetical protein